MCDLMSSPSVFAAQSNQKQTNIISSSSNGQNINCNSSKCAASSNLNTNGSVNFNNPKINKLLADYKQIVLELRAQNFDVIRFATYRTASKLRFIQKKLNLHLIDLWNVIETFRDNNLHTLDLLTEIDLNKIESCVHNMYIQLNKRLAFNQQINVESQTQLLLAWLLNLYDKTRLSKMKVISFKIALTTMCAGKLIDKLKYIFTQISDPSKNNLIIHKFEMYLKELLVLPKSVFEEPSFGYSENLGRTCFDLSVTIKIEDFLSVALSDCAPACFIWLNIFHRFVIVQNVTHPVTCSVCERTNFNGFRYKCQKCRKYQMCQDCFWRGRISHSHQLTHQIKEYTSYKSAAKQLSNSLKRSFFCKPSRQTGYQTTLQRQLYSKQPQINYNKYNDTQLQSNEYNLDNSINNANDMINKNSQIYSNNSDYNLINRHKDKQVDLSKLQAQTLNNICSTNNYGTLTSPTTSNSCNLPMINDIYSTINRQGSTNKGKQLSPTTNGLKETYLDETSNINQKSIDLSNMVSGSDAKQTTPSALNMQSGSIYAKSANYSNTLSMTRTKNNDNNNSTKMISSNNINDYTTKLINTNTDEHNIIANYCSRLADFYVKNPHLAASPTSNSPSPSATISQQTSKLKSNIKPKTTFINDDTSQTSSTSIYETLKSNRTSSLSRHLWSSNRYNKINNNQVNYNGCGTPTADGKLLESSISTFKPEKNTTRSLSECNFRSNETEDSSDSNSDERHLKEKMELVAKLEQNNKELIKEINKLKLKQLSNRSLDLTEQQEIYQQLLIQQQQQISAHQSLKYQQKIAKGAKDSTLTRKFNTTIDPVMIDQQRLSTKSSLKKSNYEKVLNNAFTPSSTMVNPTLIAELQTLKHKKGQLENRMQVLENSRDELIDRLTQLDTLMRPSKLGEQRNLTTNLARTPPNNSPRSLANLQQKFGTLNTANAQQQASAQNSPLSVSVQKSPVIANISPVQTNSTTPAATLIPVVSASMAMQMPTLIQTQSRHQTQPRSWSTPSTPALYEFHPMRLANIQQQLEKQQQSHFSNKQQSASLAPSSSSLLSLTGLSNSSTDNKSSSANLARCLRNDLLIAADSVTNAMQNLVKELNSENENVNAITSEDEEINNLNNHNSIGQENCIELNNFDSNNTYSDIRALNNINNSLDNFKTNFTLNSSINSNTLDYMTPTNNNNNFANNSLKFNQPYSLSASATPVTFRKNSNNLKLQLQQAQHQQQQLNLMFTNNNICPFNSANNRNGINLEEYDFNNLDDLDSTIITNTTNLKNRQKGLKMNDSGNYLNGDDFDNLDSMNEHGLENELNCIEADIDETKLKNNNNKLNDEFNDDEELDEDDDDDIYENYLLNESFIDDLNNNNTTSQNFNLLNHSNNQTEMANLQTQLAQQSSQVFNLNSNDQVASWRRELEQRLIDDNANSSQLTANVNNTAVKTYGNNENSTSQISNSSNNSTNNSTNNENAIKQTTAQKNDDNKQ